jgi:hypothetical protein
MEEWIKRMCIYVHTIEFYSAMKKEIMFFAGKWMELESI